jgi:hypothetical protein
MGQKRESPVALKGWVLITASSFSNLNCDFRQHYSKTIIGKRQPTEEKGLLCGSRVVSLALRHAHRVQQAAPVQKLDSHSRWHYSKTIY